VNRNQERVLAIRQSLEENRWDAFVCSLPMNVLMLTGYWPVTGASVAVATRDGGIHLIVPQDEERLARRGWADELIPYRPDTLEQITNTVKQLRKPLEGVIARSLSGKSRVGLERDAVEPFSYVSIHLHGREIETIEEKSLAATVLENAYRALSRLRLVKIAAEFARIQAACEIASDAFLCGASQMKPGMTELEAAALFQVPLSTGLPRFPGIERAGGFVSCMSGPNSARACGAYAMSTTRRIAKGDLVLIHCNSYADGFWTDITRTYSMGPPDQRTVELRVATFEARDAALTAIGPSATGSQIDAAARGVMRARGFGEQFTHSTGHGVGFSAIDGNAPPRIHPKSPDEIQAGMTFNIEPAAYFDSFGGIRHCDMVAATETGSSLLTDFQCRPEELVLDA
jgi:Xaa-Pro aminopeptidase